MHLEMTAAVTVLMHRRCIHPPACSPQGASLLLSVHSKGPAQDLQHLIAMQVTSAHHCFLHYHLAARAHCSRRIEITIRIMRGEECTRMQYCRCTRVSLTTNDMTQCSKA